MGGLSQCQDSLVLFPLAVDPPSHNQLYLLYETFIHQGRLIKNKYDQEQI